MKCIGVLSQKGGSGKTVISTNIARALQLRGNEVILVDTDKQGSARDWAATGDIDPPHTVGVDRPRVHQELPKVRGYDYAVVDGAGKVERMSASVIKACDLILIPVQPAGVDLWALGELVDLIEARQEASEGLQAAFVVSRAVVGANLSSDAEEALSGLSFPVIGRTNQRVAYAKAVTRGASVLDLTDKKAKDEINSLTDEVLQLL
ncbi:ParA family partition ATPase [Salinibacter grassmerensis]|uniref:ParA family partition ATPase n=1 Tax=Salinibacter grassmerensis TaxID=3040353 RepID=UPI0021E7A111|nr:ParA family partition ATPase [Salinibacter grassmerensis]